MAEHHIRIDRQRWALVWPRVLAVVAAVWIPAIGLSQDRPPEILLDVGLTTVAVISDNGIDYEVFRTVVAADAEAVTFALRRPEVEDSTGDRQEPVVVKTVVARLDLAEANRVITSFHSEDPESFPSATGTVVSTALVDLIRTGAPAPIILGVASGPLGMMGSRKYFRGSLTLVEPSPVPVTVLLNGVPTALPALHALGTLSVGGDEGEAEFWILDRSDNAISLRWRFKDAEVRVIRIDTPLAPEQPVADEIVAALENDACRATLNGVYFNTGSATLLPQSTAEISRVAALMADHPDWQFRIEGHNAIGTDAENLVLSQRRAEAVLGALSASGVAAGRMLAAGLGEAQPVDTNDTIEGRARNRRVELARNCQ